MPWDPDHYHRFQNERFAPFDDLLALVRVRGGMRVLDMGCGTGELTRRLADSLPGSLVLGIDTSPAMLERAQAHARPGLRFEERDARNLEGQYDLLFSHAVLQWLDDHASLIPGLFQRVAPGGQLVAQIPSNHHHAAHRLIRETAAEEPFRSALAGWTRESPVLPLDAYATLLHFAGADDFTVLEKVYPHVLPHADALAEWNRGTALVPYFERLPAELHEPFMERYRARLREAFPESPVFYPFRRILLAATRPRDAR